jgi:hypothetical protein
VLLRERAERVEYRLFDGTTKMQRKEKGSWVQELKIYTMGGGGILPAVNINVGTVATRRERQHVLFSL